MLKMEYTLFREGEEVMIKSELFEKKVKITDIDNKEFTGMVEIITSELDSLSGEREVAITQYGGLVEFKESEIKSIEIL